MSLQIQVTADVANAGKQIEDFSKKSRIALTSLSLVAQDLPFGFIGIQNNLPSVISSFGELTREAGGVGGALKQLGSALIGPAGLFLAFSAVTASVTYLIQKYGSLGNAVTALVSNNAKLIQVQNALNKEMAAGLGNTAGETAKIQILVQTLNSLNEPNKKRLNAYYELKKIAPDIVKNINEENILSQKNIDLINKQSQARIEYIKLRAREGAILNIINKNEEERIGLEQEYPALLAKKQKAEAAYNKTKGLSFDGTKTFNAGLQTEAINLESATNALNKNAEKRRELYKINNGLIDQLKPLIDGISDFDAANRKVAKEKFEPFSDIGDQGEAIEAAMSLDQVNKLLIANLKLSFGKNGIFTTVLDRLLGERKNLIKKKLAEEAAILTPKKVDKKTGAPLSAELEAQLGAYQVFLAKLQEVQATLTNVFFQPLENAFMNLFETGKFGFKAFADAVLKQIQQLVSKIIATGIIKLIASLLVPGSGAVIGASGGLAGFGQVVAQIFSGIGGPKTANPSFGGVGPGGLGMSGQVNVVLRGSDLVGALNRTNATINRVG